MYAPVCTEIKFCLHERSATTGWPPGQSPSGENTDMESEGRAAEVPMYLEYPLKISPVVVLSTVANRNGPPPTNHTFDARNHKQGGHAYSHLTQLADKEDALIVLELAQSLKYVRSNLSRHLLFHKKQTPLSASPLNPSSPPRFI